MQFRKENVKRSLPISVFFVFTVLFYGPLSLYLPNAQEMWFPIGEVFKVIIPVSVIALALMTLFFFAIPDKISRFFQKLLFGGALAFYIQGNYIKTTYGTGVLDGTSVDWSAYKTYAVKNTLLWVVCILLPFIIAFIIRNKKGLITKVLVVASLFLTVIQIPALAVQMMSYQPNENANLRIFREGIYDMSAKENVVVFMLDTLDETYYQRFLEEDPSYTDDLDGFVHYSNVVASGARTMIAVPSMFTGKPFKRQNSYQEYLNEVWSEDNALSVLHDQGYDVKVYSETPLFSVDTAEYISNFSNEEPEVGSYYLLTKKLYKLDLFKFMPHLLKRRFIMDTAEFDKAKEMEMEYTLNDEETIREFREQGLTLNETEDKMFILYHMRGAHPPFRLGRDGEKYPETSRADQVAGCMYFVKEVLQDMKDKGIYDDATILITADHGDVNQAEWNMLMIKEANAKEQYTTSDAPVSMFDMVVYLSKLAGKTLTDQEYGKDISLLKEDEIRERHFFCNSSGNSQVAVDEYMTTEHAGDVLNFKLINSYASDMKKTPYELGTVLSFRSEATASPYCTEGFGTNTGFRTKLAGPYVRMDIPMAELPDCDLMGHFDVFYRGKKEKPFILYANGVKVLDSKVIRETHDYGLDFLIPKDCFDESKNLTLEIEFPWVSQDEMDLPLAERTMTISLRHLVINKQGIEKEPYTLGKELSFTLEATADPYCTEGFWMNTGFRTKLVGPCFKMEIPMETLPKEGDLKGHLGVFYKGKKKKAFELYANGEMILKGKVTKETHETGLDFTIPVSSFGKDKTLALEIRFPWVSPDELDLPIDQRTQTISLTSLIIDRQ